MPTILEFKSATSKAEFILSSKFDKGFYHNLTSLTNISKEDRQTIAKELIAKRKTYDFNRLIVKLTDLCFTNNGPEFMRSGASDFLGDVLLALAQVTDKQEFIQKCGSQNPQTIRAFPDSYQLSNELASVFAHIAYMAQQFTIKTNDPDYTDNLGQNFANKVFFPLLIDSGSPLEGATRVVPFKTWASSFPLEVNDYFSNRISTKDDSFKNNVTTYLKDKDQHYKNAIVSITELIRNGTWRLGGFCLFQGGVSIEFEGKTVRVPHRVAEMVKLLKAYPTRSDSNVYELHDLLKNEAQKALDKPRRRQKSTTKEFYQNVIDNLYVSDDVVSLVSEQTGLIN